VSCGGGGGRSGSGGGGDLFARFGDLSGGLNFTLDKWKFLNRFVSLSDGGGDLFLKLLDLLFPIVNSLTTLEVGDLAGHGCDGGSVVINGLLNAGFFLLKGFDLGSDD
jgi:hypothetical protein